MPDLPKGVRDYLGMIIADDVGKNVITSGGSSKPKRAAGKPTAICRSPKPSVPLLGAQAQEAFPISADGDLANLLGKQFIGCCQAARSTGDRRPE